MQNFYPIPFYSNYLINNRGDVYSKLSQDMLEGSINGSGYLHYRLKSDDGVTKTLGAHRLVAMTFIGLPEGYENLDVNHINGNKLDNSVDNVEWATRLENVHHAGYMGLTSKSIPIQVLNNNTGLVTEYPTFIAAATDLGISKDAISWRVNAGEDYVDELNRQYRRVSTRSVWKSPTKWSSNPILVRNAISGKVSTYPTQKAVAEAYDVSIAYISIACSDESQPLIRLKDSLCQIRPTYPLNDWLVRSEPYRDYEQCKNCRFIVMYNPAIEKPRIFFTLSDAANAYGFKKNVPYNRAKVNRRTPWHDGLICHYLYNY